MMTNTIAFSFPDHGLGRDRASALLRSARYWWLCRDGWRFCVVALVAMALFPLFPPPVTGDARVAVGGADLTAASPIDGAGLTLRLPPLRRAAPDGQAGYQRVRYQRITGLVGRGIFASATAVGAPADAVQTYLRALGPRITAAEIDPDARYDLVIEADSRGRQHLVYAGLSQSDGALALLPWTIDGRRDWYDARAVTSGRAGFSAPVIGRRTSGYGFRVHPLLGYTRMHRGTDYGAAQGAPVRAVADGVVEMAGWHGGHGQMVKLRHAGALGSGYAHLSAILVAPGERVTRGQIIGRVGSTGLSTGPHLHFEVYRGDQTVDPASVSFASRPLLSGAELEAFRARVTSLSRLPVTRATDQPE